MNQGKLEVVKQEKGRTEDELNAMWYPEWDLGTKV